MTEDHSSSAGPRTAIIYASVHHGNTRRIAEVLAREMSADLFNVDDATALDLKRYDLVGLGSGIYFGRHHRSIRQLVTSWKLPPKRVFLFSTAGLPFLRLFQHAALRIKLQRAGSEIVDEFCCRGWDTVGPLWLMGGINRKRPNERDLARARRFAVRLTSSYVPDAEPSSTSSETAQQ